MDNMLRQPFTMIKIIFLFLSAITLFNCQSSNINNITYDKKDYVLTSLEQKLDLKDTVIGIFFEGNFSGNFTKIYFDQDLLFDKKITTDDNLGVADFYLQNKTFNKIKIIVDKDIILDINTTDVKGYKYVYISKNKTTQKFDILFSNKPHIYQ